MENTEHAKAAAEAVHAALGHRKGLNVHDNVQDEDIEYEIFAEVAEAIQRHAIDPAVAEYREMVNTALVKIVRETNRKSDDPEYLLQVVNHIARALLEKYDA